jgi:8-oxo-dGTP diphosphatase
LFSETPDRIDIALAIPLRGELVLVARRPDDAHQGGLWEFPGGRVEPGEEPPAAARRELREETGLAAREWEPLVIVVHDYAGRPLRLHVFLARDVEGEVRIEPPREWLWIAADELEGLEMPEANRAVLRALRWRLPGTRGASP